MDRLLNSHREVSGGRRAEGAGSVQFWGLLIARVDPWCGRSLLTIGVLHSSFNASETLLDADHFWVRIAVTIAVGIGLVAFGKEKIPAG